MNIVSTVMGAAAAVAISTITVFAAPAIAEEVTLVSFDGTARIAGEFVSYEDEFYTVDTIFGRLTLDSSDVWCVGGNCPIVPEFVVANNS